MNPPELKYLYLEEEAAQSEKPRKPRKLAYWEWPALTHQPSPHLVMCVHGLTRQGRDFDALAQDLSQHCQVICPDIAGRGYSDWLEDANSYAIPQYVQDMQALIKHLHQLSLATGTPLETLDWVGTSMGGLIGLALAGSQQLNLQEKLPIKLNKLLLNDVAPRLEFSALQRIGRYTGLNQTFASQEEAVKWLAQVSQGFGKHTKEEWLALSLPMLRPINPADPTAGYKLHYDPNIAQPLRLTTAELAAQGEALLWQLYDAISAPTLVIRGKNSDLLSQATAEELTQRGPKARLVTLADVGHAPTFVSQEQRQVVKEFLQLATTE